MQKYEYAANSFFIPTFVSGACFSVENVEKKIPWKIGKWFTERQHPSFVCFFHLHCSNIFSSHWVIQYTTVVREYRNNCCVAEKQTITVLSRHEKKMFYIYKLYNFINDARAKHTMWKIHDVKKESTESEQVRDLGASRWGLRKASIVTKNKKKGKSIVNNKNV